MINVIVHEASHLAVLLLVFLVWHLLNRFKDRCQEAKEMQDRINEKFQGYAEQVEEDISKVEDRVTKIEKDKG